MLPLLGRKTQLLVLDDDPSMQRLLSAILHGAGYRVDVVSSGTLAIEKLARTRYAALLLDLMTPTDGGMTVIRHLRNASPALLRRVVLVTASPDTILRSVRAEIAAVVHKPFESHALLDAVERVLRDDRPDVA
ncbi:MAG TPA: response regulator [Thermoanaerobaculia bacterium]|nr:response regulator [Thermoanaerobaculia bacterium]